MFDKSEKFVLKTNEFVIYFLEEKFAKKKYRIIYTFIFQHQSNRSHFRF